MTRSIFGWSLPPGVTQRMIDAQCEDRQSALLEEMYGHADPDPDDAQ